MVRVHAKLVYRLLLRRAKRYHTSMLICYQSLLLKRCLGCIYCVLGTLTCLAVHSGVWTRAVQCVTVVTGAYTVHMDNKDVQYAFQSFRCFGCA